MHFKAVTDLNRASFDDIAQAGIGADITRELVFWGPFRAWEDLLWLSDVDDGLLAQLQSRGFRIGATRDAQWAPPKPLRLSSAHA